MTKYLRVVALNLSFLAVVVLSTRADSVRVAPEQVQANKPVWILAKGSPGVSVQFKIASGSDCGTLAGDVQTTNEQGEAKAVFTASDAPANCESIVSTVIGRAKDVQITDAGNTHIDKKITVVPLTAVAPSIEATTALTIILIASFAIDRFVTLLMYLLPFAKMRGEEDTPKVKKREKLTYIVLAGVFGLLLGYFGDIRLLAGLGFSTNTVLNAIVTALILTAGSDGISALIKKMGGTSLDDGEPKPLIVQGDLTLNRPARACTEGGGGSSADRG